MPLKSEITRRIYDAEVEISDLRQQGDRAAAQLQGMADRALTGATVVRDSIAAKEGVYEQGNLDKIQANTRAIKDKLTAVTTRLDEILAL